jgi:hypothetical protein
MSIADTLKNISSNLKLPIGTPYNLNWRTTGVGIDCSGLVASIANYVGAPNISPTDWTGSLFPKTEAITGAVQPGDLVFFGDPTQVDSHVAIYMGGDQIYQSSTGQGVNIGSLAQVSKYYGGVMQYRRIPQLTATLSSESTYNPSPGGVLGGSTGAINLNPGSGMTQLGTIAGLPINIPSGLVLGLIAVVILLLGVIMFASTFVNVQTPGLAIKTPQPVIKTPGA